MVLGWFWAGFWMVLSNANEAARANTMSVVTIITVPGTVGATVVILDRAAAASTPLLASLSEVRQLPLGRVPLKVLIRTS